MTLQKLHRKLQHTLRGFAQNDDKQARALTGALRLFAAMLVLTLVARAAAGAALPTVTLTNASAGVLLQNLKTTGILAATDGTPFSTPEGLLVEAVYAVQGEAVTLGTPLVRFMPDSVSQVLKQTKASRAQIAQQVALLLKGKNADAYGVGEAQDILDHANAAYDVTRRKGDAAVADAARQRDAAQKALDDFLAQPPVSSSSQVISSSSIASSSSSSSYDTPGSLDTQNALASASFLDALSESNAQSNTTVPGSEQAEKEQALRQVLQQAQDVLKVTQSEASNANENARQAVVAAERARNSALHNYETSAEAAAGQTAQSRADAGVLSVTLTQQDALISTLTALLQADCTLFAPASGTLTQLTLVPGALSTAVGGAIADTLDGYALTFSLEEAQAKTAAIGMAVQVQQKNTSARFTVNGLSPLDASGTVTATVRLPADSGAWQAGAAQVTAELSRESHALTLPPTAVHEDLSGSFVYSIETRGTVLGDQDVLVRVPVTVVARSDERVAVTGGLAPQTRIADTTTKPLQAGARVRVAQP